MSIDISKIRPGDIILFRIIKTSSFLDKLIAVFSVLSGNEGTYGWGYSHAVIVEDFQHYLEMTWPKSRRTVINPLDPETEIWRIDNLTPDQAQIALNWARANLGVHYNIRHIVTLGFLKGYGCADFVSNAFKQCKIILDFEGSTDPVVSPNEIADSKITSCVDAGGHNIPANDMWQG